MALGTRGPVRRSRRTTRPGRTPGSPTRFLGISCALRAPTTIGLHRGLAQREAHRRGLEARPRGARRPHGFGRARLRSRRPRPARSCSGLPDAGPQGTPLPNTPPTRAAMPRRAHSGRRLRAAVESSSEHRPAIRMHRDSVCFTNRSSGSVVVHPKPIARTTRGPGVPRARDRPARVLRAHAPRRHGSARDRPGRRGSRSRLASSDARTPSRVVNRVTRASRGVPWNSSTPATSSSGGDEHRPTFVQSHELLARTIGEEVPDSAALRARECAVLCR